VDAVAAKEMVAVAAAETVGSGGEATAVDGCGRAAVSIAPAARVLLKTKANAISHHERVHICRNANNNNNNTIGKREAILTQKPAGRLPECPAGPAR
jgi:hypothetical protein